MKEDILSLLEKAKNATYADIAEVMGELLALRIRLAEDWLQAGVVSPGLEQIRGGLALIKEVLLDRLDAIQGEALLEEIAQRREESRKRLEDGAQDEYVSMKKRAVELLARAMESKGAEITEVQREWVQLRYDHAQKTYGEYEPSSKTQWIDRIIDAAREVMLGRLDVYQGEAVFRELQYRKKMTEGSE
ncbi:hypothetical protein H6786_04260 [Candidatus Nomurabacteria bacterium]|nr:hypothetical protein [Candidatus Nomurabacteria bacterium]